MSSNAAAAADTALFNPIRVGNITLSHRVALAPLTRCRNTAEHVPTDLTLEHYVQRASTPGTLLITEATIVHPKAGGWAHAPGIYNEEQVQAWKKIVEAVHARGSHIFLQLWALGRSADPALLTSEGNYPYVAPSPIGLSEESEHMPGGPTPRPLTIPEIREYVTWFGDAALRAAHPSLAYLHFIEPRMDGSGDAFISESSAGSGNDFARKIWAPRPFVSAGGYDGKTARYVADRYGDIIAFGRHFIANPDLPRRIKDDMEYNRYDRSTFYSVLEPKGYTDYPFAAVEAVREGLVAAS
ncbi:hypothetical protein EWM64_g2353 [Hericium alpestre]|uniref:NADH:flavin oxidoreductase/NADH oxidase N-terminal domain-containing protein n=1 Tax=Hericium alpestre TaxID=135208 RepID=A0A4Z0A4L9_9AGAM|nr:hypothetical protein EWM64_g2353 [Hericium alpestre]